MSQSLKDTESLHKDQRDTNVISSVVNSSDVAGQKNVKARDNSYDEPAKRVPQQVSKINDISQRKKKKLPFIKPRDSKTLQQKEKKEVKVNAKKGKGHLPHPHPHPVQHSVRLLTQKMK